MRTFLRIFSTRLTGAEEVPPVRTNARGLASFSLSRDGRKLRYLIAVQNIRNATAAHIHLGRRGVNGPIVAFLFGPLSRPVTVRKSFVTGTITQNDLKGPLAGLSLAYLIREMQQKNTYVNVHTTQNPNGEIRGQICRGLIL